MWTPVGLILLITLIWNLFSLSCFFAIIIILISQVLNASIAKLLIRQRLRKKVAKDSWIQKYAEYFDVIQYLRWYGWQEVWLTKVIEAREYELKMWLLRACFAVVSYTLTISEGQLFSIIAFITYTAFAGQKLHINLIFPALQLFKALQGCVREIPNLIATLLNAHVVMERIEKFNREPELEHWNPVELPDLTSLLLEDCSFAWPGQLDPILKHVNLVVQPGLMVVYSKIGSGKSALLQSLVSEMEKLHGRIKAPD